MLKVALGLSSLDIQTNIETYISTLWMFLGLSLFGFGIGNISAYLSYSNKNELEMQQTKEFFKELFFLHSIEPRFQSLINSNIDNYYSKQLDREMEAYNQVIPIQLLDQLEKAISSEFINKFTLLEKLNAYSLRLIRMNSRTEKKNILTRKGAKFDYVQFLQCGTVNLYDSDLKRVNQYGANEVFGMEEFYEQFSLKYKVNLLKMITIHMAKNDKNLKAFLKTKLLSLFINKKKEISNLDQMKNSINSKINQETLPDIFKIKPITANLKEDNELFRSDLNKCFDLLGKEFKMGAQSDEEAIISKQSSFGSEDIEYLTIPFSIIEQILFKDVDSFIQMYKQYNLYNRPIFASEWSESDNLLETFCTSDQCIMFIRADDTVFDVNDQFCDQFGIDEEILQDVNSTQMFQEYQFVDPNENILPDHLNYQSVKEKTDTNVINNIGLSIYNKASLYTSSHLKKSMRIQINNTFNLFKKKEWQIEIDNREFLVEINDIKCKNIVDQDRKSNLKRHQMNYAKSLMGVQMVQITIKDDDIQE